MPGDERNPRSRSEGRAGRGQPARKSARRIRVERGAGREGDAAGKRSGGRERAERPRLELSKPILQELHATARPGKGEVLVKVFADAAAAYIEEDYAEAIRLGEQAKHIALRSANARELLGLAYYRTGKWSEAAKELSAFRRISGSTEQNPVIADAYRAMGKPDKALDIVREMDRKALDEAVYYEGAIVGASALGDMDRLDDAIALLERLDLRPEIAGEHHLRTWYVLGDLLERKGRFTQAKEWFEAVASADADMTDAPDRARKLTRA